MNDLRESLCRYLFDEILKSYQWPSFNRVIETWLERHAQPMHVMTDLMPCLACEAVGGEPFDAIPAAAHWTLYFFAAKLFDNIQDYENHHLLWMQEGQAVAISYGLAAIAAGDSALARLEDNAAGAVIGDKFGQTWALAAKSQTEVQVVLLLCFNLIGFLPPVLFSFLPIGLYVHTGARQN